MALEIFELDKNSAHLWDDFIFSSPKGSIHQSSTWSHFQSAIPGRGEVIGLGVKHTPTNEIQAACLAVRMETGLLNTHWYYSARGPVFDTEKHKAAGLLLINTMQKTLKEKKGIFWRIDPYFTESEYHNLGVAYTSATKNFQPTDSLLLNLEMSEDEILAQMKRTGRRNLKKAQNAGIKIRSITPENLTAKDLQDFYTLNQETTIRDGFSGHEQNYYFQFVKKLAPYTQLFFAYYQGHPIATAINTFCHDKAIYYFGASSSESQFRDLRAPYLLQWEMIKVAKQKGCKTYDFTGITPENEPHHPYAGITQFKTRFGGYRDTYAAGKEITLDKFWHSCYKIAKAIKK